LGEPEIKTPIPSVIIGCPMAKGPYWLCASAMGQYFVFDIKRELNILTFDKTLNNQLGIIEEKKCTFVREHWIFCLGPNGGFLNVFENKGFVSTSQWLQNHKLDKNYTVPNVTCLPLPQGANNTSNSSSNSTNTTNCTIPQASNNPNATYLSI
jgi:hypothetical protein